jgi:hypothetical protein
MNPPPLLLGLTLCEKVIVEESTKNVTLVSTFRVNRCTFPLSGVYQLTLFLDGEWLAHRRLEVIERQT